MRIPFYAAIVIYSMVMTDMPVNALNMRSDESAINTPTDLQDATTYKRQGLSLMQTAEMAEMDRIADLELAQDQKFHSKEIPDEVFTGAQTVSETTPDANKSTSGKKTEEKKKTIFDAQPEFQHYGSG